MADTGGGNFFAIVSRMRYIERWALMRTSRTDNLSEHSLEVAMISHALATLANVRYGHELDADRAAVIALYHDAQEIITGDLPTPVKYFNRQINDAYRAVEDAATDRLLAALPEDLRLTYEGLLRPEGDDPYLLALVKAADKISALIKCIEEEAAGNTEFRSAAVSTRAKVEAMAQDMPEVRDFLEEFLPSFGRTLDELM